MATWNDKYKDKDWLEKTRKHDPNVFVSDSYLIVGEDLRDEFSCMSMNECKIGIKVRKSEIRHTEIDNGSPTIKQFRDLVRLSKEKEELQKRFEEQRNEYIKLAERCETVEKARELSDAKISEMLEELKEFKKIKEECLLMRCQLEDVRDPSLLRMEDGIPNMKENVSNPIIEPKQTRQNVRFAMSLSSSRKSYGEDIDWDEVSRTEQIILEQAQFEVKESHRSQFPYLYNVEYDSYENVSPCLLIGSPHGSDIENVEETIQIKENECERDMNKMSNEKLFDWFSYFSSIESLGINNKATHKTETKEKILELLRNGMRESKFAFAADIKSMVLSFKSNVRERKCQRVLWRERYDDVIYVEPFEALLQVNIMHDSIPLLRSEKFSEEDKNNWLEWLNEIENIGKIKIQRRYNEIENLRQCDNVEIHTFCDAGGEAFAAVSYIVTTIGNERHSNIVMAKAKVTPIRHKSRTQISEMPRLELCAALIASRLADTITKHHEGIPMKRYFWSDSEVVLRWILKPDHKLLKYAISPIEEILDKTTRAEWRYVPTKLNVADIATKFKRSDFGDSNSVWYKGPSFIRMNESHWPSMPNLVEPPLVNASLMVSSVNEKSMLNMSVHKLPPVNCRVMSDHLLDKLRPSIQGSWLKLVRATARGLKIILNGIIPLLTSKQWKNIKVRNEIKSVNDNFSTLDACDLERAEHFLIKRFSLVIYLI